MAVAVAVTGDVARDEGPLGLCGTCATLRRMDSSVVTTFAIFYVFFNGEQLYEFPGSKVSCGTEKLKGFAQGVEV